MFLEEKYQYHKNLKMNFYNFCAKNILYIFMISTNPIYRVKEIIKKKKKYHTIPISSFLI
jgi:hypothetical protein